MSRNYKRRKTKKRGLPAGAVVLVILLACISGYLGPDIISDTGTGSASEEPAVTAFSQDTETAEAYADIDISDMPEYSGESYATINNNIPYFDESDLTTEYFEYYSDLDSLGRCGAAYVNICQDTMPTEPRGSIGGIKPSGWHTYKYDFIDDKYLYNRCHLIGYQLAGDNYETNLITGTRQFNTEGMLPFENTVADYVKETDGHVIYRVTPLYDGSDLVAGGVLMEAESVEDNGSGVMFCVFVYNVQDGVYIDYETGETFAV